MPDSRPPLTIFAVPRAFQRNIEVARRSAIQSGRALRPQPRLILPGDKGLSLAHPKDFGRKSALLDLIEQRASGL